MPPLPLTVRAPLWLTLLGPLALACATPANERAGESAAWPAHTEYRLLDASRPERPAWINTPPPAEGGVQFFVGLSKQFASEVDARDAAMRHARTQFAGYTGVDVSQIDEVMTSLYGQSSGVLDPTIEQKRRTRHETHARVSRIGAREWYWERYHATRGQLSLGSSYRYWVLVEVPESEYERVQAWKRERAAAEAVAREHRAREWASEWAQLSKRHTEQLRRVDGALGRGALASALSLLDEEEKALHEALHEVEVRLRSGDGELVGEQSASVARYLDEVAERFSVVQASLVFDSGRFGEVRLAPGSRGSEIPVWVCLQQAEACHPVAHLPIVLRDRTGNVIARALSERDGRAELHVHQVPAGSYRVAIDADAGSLASLSGSTRALLAKIAAPVEIWRSAGDLEGAAAAAVAGLFNGPSFEPLPARSVVLGPATYAESGRGSAFAPILKKQLERELTAIDGLELRTPRPRNLQSVTRALHTRGIGARARPLGSAATQAVIDAADAAIETNYTLLDDELQIDLRLKSAGSDALLAASTASLAVARLPAGVAVRPAPDLEPSAPALAPSAETIHLEVTSQLGDGQTYREGEKISFFVSADRDAYLLLVYEDAARQLIQILPNRYSPAHVYPAGRFIEVPGPSDRFDFVVAGPAFGLERVWAFAASEPFATLPGETYVNGLRKLENELPALLREVRAQRRARSVTYGEAQALVTTVPR